MVEIGKTMYSDAIRPGLTKEKLQKKLDERLRKRLYTSNPIGPQI